MGDGHEIADAAEAVEGGAAGDHADFLFERQLRDEVAGLSERRIPVPVSRRCCFKPFVNK